MNLIEQISKKKYFYQVSRSFKKYLKRYTRESNLPVSYNTLRHFQNSIPLYDKEGKDTLWETVFYHPSLSGEIHQNLKRVYSLLKSAGHSQAEEHLHIERIDFCVFGNSKPFRVKIVNNYNEVHDYFYIKVADASRICGLELEHLLSPYSISYLVDDDTLVEEHIAGIPGDVFAKDYINRKEFNPKRIAKEFVKFNERCFVRLLGDMRSYNFVVDITPDIEDYQYRIRSIDFDQQCYEGRKNLYLPQFFKENRELVELCLRHLNQDSISQYQTEERTMMAFRVATARYQLMHLLNIMSADHISTADKLKQLREELSEEFHAPIFLKCRSMGQLVKRQLKQTLQKNLALIQKNLGRYQE